MMSAIHAARALRLNPWIPLCGVLAAALLSWGPAAAREPAPAFRLQGKVIRVTDGDTVRLDTGSRRYHTIRLSSIDAPETSKPDRPGQPYSQASRQALEKMILNRQVTANCYETDSYDRNICDLRISDGSSVNQAMVKAGMAWANMEGKGKFMRDQQLPGLQREAQAAGRGLWAQRDAVAPWQWRYLCWRQHRCN